MVFNINIYINYIMVINQSIINDSLTELWKSLSLDEMQLCFFFFFDEESIIKQTPNKNKIWKPHLESHLPTILSDAPRP